MDPDRLLDGLSRPQAAAVTSPAAPLCVVAAAGSGKTRVLTRRIAWRALEGSADPCRVLAVTFTRRAAAELRTRVRRLGVGEAVAAGTFHGIALAQLRQWWADRGMRAPVLVPDPARILVSVVGAGPPVAAAVAAEISWARARRLTPSAYADAGRAAGRRPDAGVATVAEWYDEYERRKRRRGVIDFDDLVERCADAFEGDGEFADRQRWRFRHLFVDEYQDLNPAHHRLVRAWLGGRTDLCVVGDADQAIYGWNGADPDAVERFTRDFPTGEVVRLDRNFRSSAEITTVAGCVLGGTGRPVAAAAVGAAPVPTVRGYPTPDAEAVAIARAVRDARATGIAWSSIGVLTRTNGRLAPIAAALRRAGIPFHAPGGERPSALSAAGGQLLDARLATGARQPARVLLSDVRLAIAEGDGAPGELERLRDDLEAFCELDPGATAADAAAWLRTPGGDGGCTDCVALSTFHRAKGLEWSVVFVAGMEAGLVPHAAARTPAAADEERRLVYVALTRASDRLHCSFASSDAEGRATPASPFVEVIEQAVAALEAARRTVDGRDAIRAVRRQLDALGTH